MSRPTPPTCKTRNRPVYQKALRGLRCERPGQPRQSRGRATRFRRHHQHGAVGRNLCVAQRHIYAWRQRTPAGDRLRALVLMRVSTKITPGPKRRDTPFSTENSGGIPALNGEAFGFSTLQEGNVLPTDTFALDLLA